MSLLSRKRAHFFVATIFMISFVFPQWPQKAYATEDGTETEEITDPKETIEVPIETVEIPLEIPIENEIQTRVETALQVSDEIVPEPEEEPIPVPAPPAIPRLSTREMRKNIVVDKKAAHSCEAEVFRVDISDKNSAHSRIILHKDTSDPYTVEVGGLPNGIDVVLSKNKTYLSSVDTNERVVDLEITNEDGSQKGDFSIPIIYTKKGADTSVTICQINIINQ